MTENELYTYLITAVKNYIGGSQTTVQLFETIELALYEAKRQQRKHFHSEWTKKDFESLDYEREELEGGFNE